MAYQVNKFNGTQLTSVADGTIDTSTDLTFIGKNYAGYGEVQNENFLHLLESFSNATQPPKAIQGQLWYDTSTKKIKVYDNEKFKVLGGAEYGSVEPVNPARGDLWFNSTTFQLHAWDGTTFKLIGPDLTTGQSALASPTVIDKEGVSHKITTLSVNGKVVVVLNKDAEFTLDSAVIPDFTLIKKGITLADSADGISGGDWIYWGTSSNSLKLGGFDASLYMRKDNPRFETIVRFDNPGFTVGNNDDLYVRIEGSDQAVIGNKNGNPITFNIKDSTAAQGVLVIAKQVVMPGNSNVVDLGSNTNRWKDVYVSTINSTGTISAPSFEGNTTGIHSGNVISPTNSILLNATTGLLTGNVTGNLTGNVLSPTGSIVLDATTGNLTGSATKLTGLDPSVLPTPNTVVVRDGNGNINVAGVIGTIDTANKLKVTDYVANGSDVSMYRTATIAIGNNTIAVRNSTGDINANKFNGLATSAQYADLAEKYLTDSEYTVGTVVTVGGSAEVTACNIGDYVIGVVSENPAFMMNSGLTDGTYIALKGRVPVLVSGPVTKGSRLTAGSNGVATTSTSPANHIFAIALETSDVVNTRLIEAVVL